MKPFQFPAWVLVSWVLSGSAQARPDTQAEAGRVLTRFFSGQEPLNPTINRLEFLGEQRLAAAQTLHLLKRTQDARRRRVLLEFLAALRVDDDDVETVLLRELGGSDVTAVTFSAKGLGLMKRPRAVKPLCALLNSPVAAVRRAAATALGDLAQAGSGASLMKAASSETELDIKLAMLLAVGASGDRKQAAPLEGLLNEDSEMTRLAAARALCRLGSRACAPVAQRLLASSDRAERLQGVMLFQGAKASVARAALTPVLAQSDDVVRARAARLLVEGGDGSKLDWLVVESVKAKGDARLVYETELDMLRLTDERRQLILKKAGLQ
jgi:HEAT repeat protein